MQIIKICYSAGLLLSLTACTNALYFYETDKISFTIEARPDSSQPVQGNFGLKQRIALVTPRISNRDEAKPDDREAVSTLASFRFTKEPGSFGNIGDMTIKTAFITGDAAANLDHDPINAALAIVGDNKARNIDASISILTNVLEMMEADTTNTQAQNLAAQLDSIGQFIIPDEYPLTLYNVDPNKPTELQEEFIAATSTSAITRDVAGVSMYLDQLDNAVNVLDRARLNPNKYSLGGQVLNNPVSLAGLKAILANTKTESKKAHDKLLGNPIYQKSIEFYIDNYLLNN